MRQRTVLTVEDPVKKAVAQATLARDPKMVREAFEPLQSLDAESTFPGAVQLLELETSRPRRLAAWIGGISLGIPVVTALILLVCGVQSELILGIIMGLMNVFGAGAFVGLLLWWQVSSRWLLIRQAALRLTGRLVDPVVLPDLIELAWLSRRRQDSQVTAVLEAALVRLLTRFDSQIHTLPELARKHVLALAARGSDDLKVAALLTLASLKDPLVVPLARQLKDGIGTSERVRLAARECLSELTL